MRASENNAGGCALQPQVIAGAAEQETTHRCVNCYSRCRYFENQRLRQMIQGSCRSPLLGTTLSRSKAALLAEMVKAAAGRVHAESMPFPRANSKKEKR